MGEGGGVLGGKVLCVGDPGTSLCCVGLKFLPGQAVPHLHAN